MNRAVRYLLQAVLYTAFCATLFYFSTSPAYQYLAEDEAEIMLAFTHPTKRKEACQKRTAEELKRLPPNMRRSKKCPRERSPLVIALSLDKKPLALKIFTPPGIHLDGSVFVYAKFFIPAGKYELGIQMRDSIREGYDYLTEKQIDFQPGQMLVIGFDPNKKDFSFN